ncbi:ABC transporter substrate-binding protein, partial [Chloroflexota bacterium]
VSASMAYTLNLTNESLGEGDWAKGPAGTGETEYWLNVWAPEYEVGSPAESWEMPDQSTLIFHIRKGVHYALNPQSEASRLMGGREFTSEDVAFTLNRAFSLPMAYWVRAGYKGWLKSIETPDKYTVVLKVEDAPKHRTSHLWQLVLEHIHLAPKEVIEKYGDTQDWKHSAGIGPFMLVDAIAGSAYILEKNTNYWMKDPVHPENQLPYLDGIKCLIIPDISTRMAAIRTGKVDRIENVGWEDGATLIKTNPELQYKGGRGEYVNVIFIRIDKPELPIGDVRVRRALFMATDFEAILNDYYGGNADIISWPTNPAIKAQYVPFEEMSDMVKEQYTYNPEKAKQLLAEAGYPNGFKTSVNMDGNAERVDLMSVVKANWAEIGVDLELDIKEYSVFISTAKAHTYPQMTLYVPTNSRPDRQMYTIGGSTLDMSMTGGVPYLDERRGKILSFEYMQPDKLAERNQLVQECNINTLEGAYQLALPTPNNYAFWQPWLQNYRGESSVGMYNFYRWPKYVWVDQDMKKEMTGR